ncbi:MAG: PE-PGRS family protein [Chitinophagaceae bacterium]|nr:MAG: PE-PGRS family protein [Chitinophagaceae bacterium]
MNAKPFLLLAFALVHISACSDKDDTPDARTPFVDVPVTVKLGTQYPEVSGMAASYSQPGNLWLMEDGGNPTRIALVGTDGSFRKNVILRSITNRDWEEMSIVKGQGSGPAQLYVADIGNNNAAAIQPIIYNFDEPAAGTDTVQTFRTIRFNYPDGNRDAEAFLVDPLTRDIFIITKREEKSGIYRIAFPYADNAPAEKVGELGYNSAVAADISQDGTEILVKTYSNIWYYKRKTGEPVALALSRVPVQLGYQLELQGESLCLGADNQGFYTVPEMPVAGDQSLGYYHRR